MKNKDFFYLQYDRINWENQEKTKINSFVNDFVIREIIMKKRGPSVKIFDIGFGIGFFIRMLCDILPKHYSEIIIEGCEPSKKNYAYFAGSHPLNSPAIGLRAYDTTFENVKTDKKFDFITSIYTFTNFVAEELEETARKIYSMLNEGGKFVLVVADENYLLEKLKSKKDLFIEEEVVKFNGKKYKEFLHYSDIPQIGKVIDYNREEAFYLDLFKKSNFELIQNKNLNDNGFVCTVFVFERK